MDQSKKRCYFGCVNESPVHFFPQSSTYKWEAFQEKRYQEWIKILDKKTLEKGDAYIKRNIRICHEHFTDANKFPSGFLTKTAIPTLNLGVKKNPDVDLHNKPVIDCDNKPTAEGLDEHVAAPPSDADKQPGTETQATQPSHEDDIRSATDSVLPLDTLAEESVVPEANTFSWQQPSEVVPILVDDVETEVVVDSLSMYCDDGDRASLLSEQLDGNNKGGLLSPAPHEVFRCNMCDAAIAGFRYTCVQCSDLDLCGACEAARAHHHHYVLRVPADRRPLEVQLVLATIRRHLMRRLDPITHPDQDWDDRVSIKSEVKSESEDQSDDSDHDEEPRNIPPVDDALNDSKVPISVGVAAVEVEDCSRNSSDQVEKENKRCVKQYAAKTNSAKIASNKKIIIKRANIIDVKYVQPLAKKIRLLSLPNREAGTRVEGIKSHIKEKDIQQQIKVAGTLPKVKTIIIRAKPRVKVSNAQSKVVGLQPENKVTSLIPQRDSLMQSLPRVASTQPKTYVARMPQLIVADGSPQKEATRVQDECFVRLQRLPPEIMLGKTLLKLSQTRFSRDDSRDSSDEDR